MFKDKRGQGLSMNIVVVAIIAVIILVIIAIIFTGGVGRVWNRMGEFFQIGTTGRSLEFIQQQCDIACSTAQTMGDPSRSSYCQQSFQWDQNTNGKIEEGEADYRCYDSRINVPCAGIDESVCKGT